MFACVRKQTDDDMTEEDHYDTPWEFLARPTSVRLSSADIRQSVLHKSPGHSPHLPDSPSFSAQLVQLGNSPGELRRRSTRSRTSAAEQRSRDDENLLERNVDRVEAEKRLEGRRPGDFLLRYRSEGSAALSLKSNNGILHIKLERRDDKWIVGEGPCFRSINSALHYYYRHPLPIRGAEPLQLNRPIGPDRRLS